jgi:selenocysteine lyase/cysteine desulfurase
VIDDRELLGVSGEGAGQHVASGIDACAGVGSVTNWPLAAIVTFQPGALDPAKLATALYEREHIACSARSGADRPGLRLSPHFYNSLTQIERIAAAIRKYMGSGV